ncbi:MAG: hypothetical protein IPO07_11020 [Haliscomenobacter sp.]|nr:hypothetical protein [Haliscomenobacter sp.]MBK9489255.1 hypothetical protein [Haliscomenobacter sp.]
MQKVLFQVLGGLCLMFCLYACKPQAGNDAWTAFTECGTSACVEEVLAVKDAFLKDPKAILTRFNESDEKGEDSVVGWLYILRDSVLVNSSFASIEERFALQQQILEAAKPFAEDPKYKDMANFVLDEVGALAIASELEDDVVEPATEPFNGNYAFELPNDGGSGELLVSQISAEQFKFKLTVVGGKPAHNQGMMEGTANILGTTADFSTSEFGGTCKLSFNFGDGVEITTLEGDPATCGFGNGVKADGVYRRTSFNDPFLSAADAKKVKQLQGNWRSLDDPKSVVKIVDGKYIDEYDGKEVSAAICLYYPKCPGDCGPAGGGACLKITAQDDVCYSLVSLTATNLELSPNTGRGNTNRYVRF